MVTPEDNSKFKAGFVSIVGKPNVGKSTLMNGLVGEKLSIVTNKAQTTRHRIFGILNGDNYQVIYSDTPGVLTPKYELQQNMMSFVHESLVDSDVILFMVELGEKYEDSEFLHSLQFVDTPVIFILNKIDTAVGSQAEDKLTYWKENFKADYYIAVSANEGLNTNHLFDKIIELLPSHPPYYDQESLTDRPERFFVTEIVREKIFLNYKQEVPYSSEVEVEFFKESEDIIRMGVIIYVERDSQKGILIGRKGESLKKVGIEARKDLETFFQKQIHLETHVKVEKDWRKRPSALKKFGYQG